MASSRRVIARLGKHTLGALAVALAIALASSPAHAQRKRIAVLKFDGPEASAVRKQVGKLIKKRHAIVSFGKVKKTAKKLGLRRENANSLSRIALEVGVDGFVKGRISERGRGYRLVLTLRAGNSGRVFKEQTIDFRSKGELSKSNLREIDRELVSAMKKLVSLERPVEVRRDRRAPPPPSRDDDDLDDDDDDDDDDARGRDRDDARRRKPRITRDRDRDDRRSRNKPRIRRGDRDDDDRDRKGRDDRRDRDRDDRGERDRDARNKPRIRRGDRDDDDDAGRKPRISRGDRDDRDRDSGDKPRIRRGDRDDDDDDDEDARPRRVAADVGDEGEGNDREDPLAGETRKRAAPLDDPLISDEVRADRAVRGRGMEFLAGASALKRDLEFNTDLPIDQQPLGYKSAFVPAAVLRADVFPLAFNENNEGFTRNVGITGSFHRVLQIATPIDVGGMVQELGTTVQGYGVGAVLRYNMGNSPTKPTIKLSARYNKLQFLIDKQNDPAIEAIVDSPNVDYTYVDPGIEIRYPFSPKLALHAEARALLVLDTGEMQAADQYGPSTVTGFDAGASAEYMVNARLSVRVGAQLVGLAFDFDGGADLTNNRDGDPADQDVGGAFDRYLGGYLLLGYLF